jgi:hypothetical protein
VFGTQEWERRAPVTYRAEKAGVSGRSGKHQGKFVFRQLLSFNFGETAVSAQLCCVEFANQNLKTQIFLQILREKEKKRKIRS